MKIRELTEIILTPKRGFVEKETGRPVEVLGGKTDLAVFCRYGCYDGEIKRNIENYVGDFDHRLPRKVNGYILHAKSIPRKSSFDPKREEQMVAFSAVRYAPRAGL